MARFTPRGCNHNFAGIPNCTFSKSHTATMPRYNTFNQIHKALIALLYDTALCLQQTDFGTKEECDAAVEKLVAVLDLFEAHAHQEDDHLLPALFDFEPSVVDAFEQEHVKVGELSQALCVTIAEIYRTKAAAERLRLGRRLTSEFDGFMILNLDHMAKEEDVLNRLLWQYYTDAELQAMERANCKNITGKTAIRGQMSAARLLH
jgi:hypothetical protein